MKNQRGFIHIPILIAIITGVIMVGGVGYVGIQKFRAKTEKGQGILSRKNTLSNSEIINQIKPAIVYIETEERVGSGMLIDREGYILTNAHVVTGVSAAKVKLSDGSLFSAEVTGRDEIMDLAVLKITGSNFPKVIFGNSDNVVQGEDVFTLGYPFGLEGDVSFKEGTISRKIIDDDMTYLETSAEIHPGNSGGPLVNKYGEVIGVNTAALGQTIEGVTLGETIKLAIPINVAKSILSELKSGRNIVVEQKKAKTSTSGGSSGGTVDNTKSDSFIVTYDKTGNPVTWAILDRAAIIINDTLDTYTTSLPTIQKVQDDERETLSSAYRTLANTSIPEYRYQIQTLISHEEVYIAAGGKFIGLLTDLIKNYRGVLNVIEKREPQLYLYYSGEVEKLESQKKNIVEDYAAKQKAKQDYAKSILTQ